MKSLKQVFLYGFFIWLIPFLVGFLIYPIHDSNRPLFESIMPVVISVSVICFSVNIFRKMSKDFIREGLKIGLIWLGISIGIDLLMFTWGPMKMALVAYMADIGITYLIIPVITLGFSLVVQKRK